jgi:hypothetical protein
LSDGQIYVAAGHNNGRDLPRFGTRGKLVEQLVAAQTGQMDVEHDQVGPFFVNRAQRGPSVGDVRRLETGHPQHAAIQPREIDVVLDEENPFAGSSDHVDPIYNFHSGPNYASDLAQTAVN